MDSTVAATLMNRAIGNRFHAVLVDNGLLRQGVDTPAASILSIDIFKRRGKVSARKFDGAPQNQSDGRGVSGCI